MAAGTKYNLTPNTSRKSFTVLKQVSERAVLGSWILPTS